MREGLVRLPLAPRTLRARFMITETRALTDRPFNVNLFVHAESKADEARAENWLNALRPLFQIHGAEPAATLRQLGMLFRPIAVLTLGAN